MWWYRAPTTRAPARPDREPVNLRSQTHTVAMTSPPFRVETVPVRRASRLPTAVAALAVVMVVVAIVKPWDGTDQAQLDRVPASPVLAAVNAPLPTPYPPGPAKTPAVSMPASAAILAPGQVECGSADWQVVTLGTFLSWTVRTWIAIAPVEAGGPGDPTIPVLSLGGSDVAGMGVCAPATRPGALSPASRIVAAWRQSAGGATAAAFGRVALSDLDIAPLGGPAGGPADLRSTAPVSVVELVRPFPATQRERWPAGRYILLLASPDRGPDRWIAVDIGGAPR
jgi:hypothetical protein